MALPPRAATTPVPSAAAGLGQADATQSVAAIQRHIDAELERVANRGPGQRAIGRTTGPRAPVVGERQHHPLRLHDASALLDSCRRHAEDEATHEQGMAALHLDQAPSEALRQLEE